MAIVSEGTVSVVQNSATVTGVDTLFVTRGVAKGDEFYLTDGAIPYIIASVASETSLTLQETYKGATTDDSTYEILVDFLSFNVPKLYPETQESFPILNHIHSLLIAKIKEAGAAALEYQITTRMYLGQPVQGDEFGNLTFDPDAQIDKVRLSTDNSPPDTNLVLDIAINDVYQALNLTLPAFSPSVSSAALTYQVAGGEIVKFKWSTVGISSGDDYYIDITWHATTALIVRYDFYRYYIGQLVINKIIGSSYYPPVKSTYYAVSYEMLQGSEGAAVILELLKNGTSLGTPVTVTITALSTSGKVTHTQTNFETTDTYSWKITQIGTLFPGEDLILTSHSFRIE